MADELLTEASRARVFFALWPPPSLQRALHDRAVALKPACAGRVMRAETLHLTLAFVGEVPRAQLTTLIDVGEGTLAAPFRLQLDLSGYWPHNRIVWLGTQQCPPALQALAGRLGDALAEQGFTLEKRRFHPHVTLLRKAQRHPEASSLPPLIWDAQDFVLVESLRDHEGARYHILARWRLEGQMELR